MRRTLLLCLCILLGTLSAVRAAEPQPLVIGVPPNSAPLSFLNASRDGLLGLAVDLSVLIGRELGRKIVFVQSNARKLEQKLRRGEIDAMIGLLPVNLSNDFSDVLVTPLALNRAILVVGQEHQFVSENDLAGRRVILQRGDTYIGRMRGMGCTIVEADSISNALSLLVSGRGDAYIASSVEMAFHVVQRRKIANIRVIGGSLERIPMVMMVAQRPGLLENLTSALVHLERNGDIETLRTRWLGRSLYVPSLWEKYRTPLLLGLLVLFCLALVAVAWIQTLKRQVSKISRQLWRSERKYRDLIRQSPDIILLLDASGRILLANRTARDMLHIEEEQSPVLMQELCGGDGCLRDMMTLMREQGQLQREIILNRDTEQELILEVSLCVTDIGGDDAVSLVGRDLTQRRRLARQVMEMERLAVIGKLAAGVAHEINNPVGIIMSHAQLAQEFCPADSPLLPMLKAIHRNGERAAATTKRLMNLALPSTVQREPQDLAQTVRDCLFFLKVRLRTVRVDVSMLPCDLVVTGNHTLLEQVILNLLINALDSMEEQPEKTRCLAIDGQRAADGVRLDITDTGHGISPDIQDRIFDPFFSTKGGKGFGLGLYITRHILGLLGADLAVVSAVGAGTTMAIRFPVPGPQTAHRQGDAQSPAPAAETEEAAC